MNKTISETDSGLGIQAPARINALKLSAQNARVAHDWAWNTYARLFRSLLAAARLRRRCLMQAAVLFAFALSGCSMLSGTSATQAVAQVEWSSAEDAILIQVDAEDQLNEVGTEPHTLLLGVIQTSDANSFRKLTTFPGTLANALAGAEKNPAILQLTRYVVQPNDHTILLLNRAAKAKVVGLIAGYYGIDTQSSARLFQIPIEISNQAIFGHDYAARAQTLALHIVLGRQSIGTAKRINPVRSQMIAAEARAHAKQKNNALDDGGKEIPLAPVGGHPYIAVNQPPN